ncbi:hypothetical protein [Nocardioides donggukensis]|uniref:EfeO-type cupredoxin-like domain-containing protein n=1 Tax=Nocardioides donggukensis TaxID=2774019 RepID=A0A927K1P8_9ACTN|nr:hypothetical protein [Nocardioides donggukensis]MBD8868737.1 hypothetical protein [Nocardioides donggukensis]
MPLRSTTSTTSTTSATSIMAATALLALTVLGGCAAQDDEASPTETASAPAGSSGPDGTEESPTPEQTPEEPEALTLEITISGGEVTPNGKRVEVGVGEPVRLRIDSDVAGELHAHATPEQEVSFGAGTSQRTLRFGQPGVVDLELHEPARVVAQFEVR